MHGTQPAARYLPAPTAPAHLSQELIPNLPRTRRATIRIRCASCWPWPNRKSTNANTTCSSNASKNGTLSRVMKELADFDFSCLPMLNKAQILDLARGEYIQQKQRLIFIGNPGLGKTHLATGLGCCCLPPRTPCALLDCGWTGERTASGSG